MSKERILAAIEAGELAISGFNESNLDGASYTFSLSGEVFHQGTKELLSGTETYELKPGEFVCATTSESLDLKGNYICLLGTRSTLAREGIDCLQTSTICEPDTNGRLTLEIVNHSNTPQQIQQGEPVVKGVFIKVG